MPEIQTSQKILINDIKNHTFGLFSTKMIEYGKPLSAKLTKPSNLACEIHLKTFLTHACMKVDKKIVCLLLMTNEKAPMSVQNTEHPKKTQSNILPSDRQKVPQRATKLFGFKSRTRRLNDIVETQTACK